MVSQPEKQAENDNNNKPQEPRELLPCPLSQQNASPSPPSASCLEVAQRILSRLPLLGSAAVLLVCI